MRALRKDRGGPGLALRRGVVPPEAAAGEVPVRVIACGVCGSDLHIHDSDPAYAFVTARLPVTLGHEFVGVPLQGRHAGRRVVVRPSVTCGRCDACVARRHDDCERRTGLGMTRDGAFAPTVVVPERNCVPVPDAVPDRLAALAEPLTIAMRAVELAGPLDGRRVWVMGPGTIGAGIALLARRAGAAHVAVSGRDDAVRLAALRAMGFDDLVDVARASQGEAAGDGAPFDVVFEATGAPETIVAALPRLRRAGLVVATGIAPRPLVLDTAVLVRREARLCGSFRAPEDRWPACLDLIAAMRTELAPMVSHELPLADALEGVRLSRERRATKVLLRPGPDDDD